VEEAERSRAARRRRGERPRAPLEQLEGADDVGVHELAGALDRAVDVTLGREVDDGVDASSAKSARTSSRSAMSPVHERVARVRRDRLEALAVPRVGELVEHHHGSPVSPSSRRTKLQPMKPAPP
jgi:hypothetical protein